MVETMVMLAHKLGMTTCAEGVETQAELDFLEYAGCDDVQGYLISRPVPDDELIATVIGWNNRPKADQAA